MRRWTRGQAISRIVLGILLASLSFGHFGHLINSLLMLGCIGVIGAIIRFERKLVRHQQQTLLIQTVNHHRHDWVNDLQLLFGYISMKKYDRLPAYVDTIKEKVTNDSAIAQLGVPSLVAYLLTYRTHKHSVSLDVQLGHDVQLTKLPIDAVATADLICDTIDLITRHSTESTMGANILALQLNKEETCLRIGILYNGGQDRELQPSLSKLMAKRVSPEQVNIANETEECKITIPIPFIHS